MIQHKSNWGIKYEFHSKGLTFKYFVDQTKKNVSKYFLTQFKTIYNLNLSFEMWIYGLKFYFNIWSMTDFANNVWYKWLAEYSGVYFILEFSSKS